MKVYGNLELFKERINQDFDKQVDDLHKETGKQETEINDSYKAKIKEFNKEFDQKIEQEANSLKVRVINEEKLKAKVDYEEEREKLINEVFDKATEQLKKAVHTKKYVDYIKAKLPKLSKMEIIADSDFFKQYFKNVKVDASLTGMKVISGNEIYDFTADSLMDAKKDSFRSEVVSILLGGN